jgi:hypothetical protein
MAPFGYLATKWILFLCPMKRAPRKPLLKVATCLFWLYLAAQPALGQAVQLPTPPQPGQGQGAKGMEVVKKNAQETYSFGVQFINEFKYDGECAFYKEGNVLMFSAVQLSSTDDSYLRIQGRVKSRNATTIVIVGTIEIKIRDCVAEKRLEREWVFTKHGSRKYWRIQNPGRSEISSDYECALYIDINH